MSCLYDRGDTCFALSRKVCRGCGFRTSAGEQMDSEEKAFERLRGLKLYQQLAIADKYYKGRMPWQGKGAPRL